MFSKKEIHFTLIALCFLFYANILNNGFVSDDIPVILENPQLAFGYRIWYDPQSVLNSLSFHISRLSPFAYHAISIVLHSANTILVFWFLRLFFGLQASFIGACFFAVHPVHAEAVSWISGRPYLSLTFFILGTYLLYQRAANLLKEGKIRSGILIHLFALLFYTYFLINSFSFYALFPLLIILSDVTFGQWRKRWLYWLPFIALVACRIILAREVITQRIYFVETDLVEFGLRNPFFCFVRSFFTHLWLLIWPAKLSLHHAWPDPPRWLVEYSAFFFAPVIFLLILTFNRLKILFFASVIFIIFLIPTYSHLPIASVVAERYAYFPSIALCICMAFIFQRYQNRLVNSRKYLIVAFGVVILVLGIRTVVRNEDWKSQDRFWRETVKVAGDNPRVRNNLGLVYLNSGNISRAINEFRLALQLNPRHFRAYNNLGVVFNELGEKDKAIYFLNQAVTINPKYAEAYYNLGVALDSSGAKPDAVAAFNKAIELKPDYIKAYNELGNVYMSINKNKEAREVLQKAVLIFPEEANSYYNLANLCNLMGNKEEAAKLYAKTIALDPGHMDAYNNLANVYYQMGDNDKAVELFRQAIKNDPGYAKAYGNLGNLYARCGLLKEAVGMLKKAVEINPTYASAHFNLAVAYFQKKEYVLSIQHCDKAVSLGYQVPPGFLKEIEGFRVKP